MPLTIDDLRAARDAHDPALVSMTLALVDQPDEDPETPIPEHALTLQKVLGTLREHTFGRKSREEQERERIDLFRQLEENRDQVPLPERIRLHEFLMELWTADDAHSREAIVSLLRRLPLRYGPWRAMKAIFKEAEDKQDWEVFAALAARFDRAFAQSEFHWDGPTRRTVSYLVRRAWRVLRRIGQTIPACYPDLAGRVLAEYPGDFYATATGWVLPHILFHDTKKYGWRRFQFGGPWALPKDKLKHRAFPDAWRRSFRPALQLLETGHHSLVLEFAGEMLKTDFRSSLRDIDASWIPRLIRRRSPEVDEVVVWLLKTAPQFEQARFRELGLHEAILLLFSSGSKTARGYAVEYAKTHARDLDVPLLIRLMTNADSNVRKFAEDRLSSLDPRKDVGLDAWGELLDQQRSHTFASKMIPKHFGAADLTPEWFLDRLASPLRNTTKFAQRWLLQVHDRKALGAGYFLDLLDRTIDQGSGSGSVQFAFDELKNFDLNTVPTERWTPALLSPTYWIWESVLEFIDFEKLKPGQLDLDLLKALAYEPDWNASETVQQFKQTGPDWAHQVRFDEMRSARVLDLLSDVRKFSPGVIGFEWLLELVSRPEARYHDFAEDLLIRTFVPADFAPDSAGSSGDDQSAPPSDIVIDLEQQPILFTGKLATMTRAEAQKKIKEANGTVAKSVTAKLKYLVIGDEGSPLYGEGKKGSKQVKAEELIESGADLKIVSETAFLRMLAGEQAVASEDQTEAGCQQLWELATAQENIDAPVARFARKYLKQHHPDMALAETDRPVDPGAEVPESFLTFERFKPLLTDSRGTLREFALDFARYELARWSPPAADLIDLCESPHDDVRSFIVYAILGENRPETRRFRLDPHVFPVDAVYAFCESHEEATRQLGMELITRSDRLRQPTELYRLTESPDRRVREFVIHTLWSVYRDRAITGGWTPTPPPERTLGAKTKRKSEERRIELGDGAPPRPDQLPAGFSELRQFLRRTLFQIPPGRPGGRDEETPADAEQVEMRHQPRPARKAKLHLIETLRDLAMEEQDLAALVGPLFEEFAESKGLSERAACLVALTRLQARYGTAITTAG